jgi:asparagine synthase (glutamine-hydrolysing)
MCGISGIINRRNEPVPSGLIERITDLVAHRGPDGKGYFTGPFFAFGHRRLSILDLSNHGHQPMRYRDRYCIIFNGEIYNYLELRGELGRLGYEFHSGTDTEVIVAAYAAWGRECCRRFNGMWAFAIHDALQHTIFFSRDRFGVKPLYYSETAEHFVFGSELKQLLAMQDSPRVNRRVLVESLLTSFDEAGPETFFDGVRSFPQGHAGLYDLDTHRFTLERYYQLAVDPELSRLTEVEAVAKLQTLFEDAVRIRLRSDVRVGTCLSGGLDSSATSAVGSRLYHASASERFLGIHARSIDAERDESAFARIAATHSDIDLHVVEPSIADFASNMDELIDTQEEPFGSPSMFMGWHVFRRAKELGCRVMLNGQGGDEVLLGYERYFSAFLRSLSPKRFLAEAIAQSRHSKLSLRDVLLYNLYFTNAALRIRQLKRRSFLLPRVKDAFDFEVVRSSTRSFRDLESLQLLEISRLQLPHLLRYEDRNSMRHSVETRLPFLDYRVVELAVSLPAQHKIHDGWTKYALRKAMDGQLPAEIVWRKDKMGFEAPERTWLASVRDRMKCEIAGSAILGQITRRDLLLQRFENLPLRRQWAYFMVAAWERRLGVSW